MWRGISLAIVAYAKTVLEGRYGKGRQRWNETAKRAFHFSTGASENAVCPRSTKLSPPIKLYIIIQLHKKSQKYIYIHIYIYIIYFLLCIIMIQDSIYYRHASCTILVYTFSRKMFSRSVVRTYADFQISQERCHEK